MLTVERLRELLDYDPQTGLFRWNVRKAIRISIGDIAGTTDSKGYIYLAIDGIKYRANRLAWFYVHGVWPTRLIDHKNRVRSDNSIDNLRQATNSENLHNREGACRHSKSGILGVSWMASKKKWEALLTVNGIKVHRSRHKTIESAIAARRAAELKFHPFRNEPCES